MSDKIKMRPLMIGDVFKMSKILKKMNLKLDFILTDNGEAEDDAEKTNIESKKIQVGIQFFQRILENLHLAENEVNEFMADLVGMSPEEFSKLDLEVTLEIFNLFKQQKGIANFLKLAGQ